MKGTFMGEFEELVLLTVAIIYKEAYGLTIMDEVEARSGRKVTISTVHATLHRLEEKGFLRSYLGGATKERGGRKKRFFEVTSFGKRAINEARELRNGMWQDIPEVLWQA